MFDELWSWLSNRLIVASPAVAIVLFLSGNAHSYDSLFKKQCSVQYNASPPVHTECVIRSSMAQGAVFLDVETPDDKHYIIETERNNIYKWLLNRQHAVENYNNYQTCYKNNRVEICLDNADE
jgi:hypothetical protein